MCCTRCTSRGITNICPVCISFLRFSFFPLLLLLRLPREQIFMIPTTPTVPNEESPLLGEQRDSTKRRITGSEPEAATLAGPSNRGSRTSSVRSRGGTNASERSGVTKKTPLPWAQFSITLLLLLTEPLTSQIISPVSSSAGFLEFCFGIVLY